MTAPDDLTSTRAAIEAAERAFSGDIRCSRSGGQTCAKCNDGAECSVCYTQRHGRVLLAEVRRLTDPDMADRLRDLATDLAPFGCRPTMDAVKVLDYARVAIFDLIRERDQLREELTIAENARDRLAADRTVGTTTDGRAALQTATRPLTFAGIDLRPSMQAFPGFWAAALSTVAAERMNATGRTPIATRTPKDGDTIASFRDLAEIDALPEGAQFVGPTHDPADPGGPGYIPLTKGADGRWHGLRTPLTSAAVSMLSGRTLVLPVKRTPKDGDRLDSFTAAELDALPVGARFDDNNSSLSPLVKGPYGWSRAGTAGFCTSADMRSLGLESRTLVLPKPAEAPKPAASPKVGDRLRDLTPEQRASLPIGTVLAPDAPGRFAMTKGDDGRWRDSHYPEPCETQWLNLDRPILSLPTPPAAPKVGDRWGNLTPDQRAALPVGTVIKEEGCITVAAWTRLPSGWSRVVVDTSATAFYIADTCEPTKTSVIASLPVSK